MKKSIFKMSILAILLGIVFIACEKEGVKTEIVEFNEEEFTSETGNHDQVLDIKNEEIQQPLLHMSFDKNLSKEENELKWKKKVKEYVNKNANQNKGVSTHVIYEIITHTGSQPNHDTNGDVMAKVEFVHDQGRRITRYLALDNGDDRNTDQVDVYLFDLQFNNTAISWIEVDEAHLRLRGTNNWFVKSFDVAIWKSDQTVPATSDSNGAFLLSDPNLWMDNQTETGWDYYHAEGLSYSRVNF
ncbi:hypothetical protein [Aquimarina algiphila]|uniref:Lipoprotein n=1 Tax=Aquimarina algiphila TaxID=2047982 RepID=A0A554VBN7_9FLAO|nr:hypothetical protein [Aquimarina algiphila]TSE03995.1 hypothetical protein FOF46_27800 [Aquimarina algiphila]